MGRIAGIQIKNYGSLKNIKLGKLLGDNSGRELTNMNAIIGQSGTGKSTLAENCNPTFSDNPPASAVSSCAATIVSL